jgi:nucleoside-diphosphate-sugar epimerase
MRHLITGGSGFLGNQIARRLHDRGESVRVLDVWEDPSRPREIEYVQADVCDGAAVAKSLQGVDVVHHNAALVPLTKSGERFWKVNVDGTRIVAEQSARAGVRAFVHMSSSAIFGAPEHCPIIADTPCRPVEIYGRAKLAGEEAAREVSAKSGMPLIVVRPRTILGLGRLGIFQTLFNWIQEGRSVYVIGDGNHKFQFVHAEDLMDFYMLALDLRKPGIYNVGTDRFGTLRECLEGLIAYAGTLSRVRSLPERLTINTLKFLDLCRLSPLAPWHYLTYHKAFYFDVAPLLALGWQPRRSNDEMLRESYDWFRSNRANGSLAGASPHRRPLKEGALWLLKKMS